MRFTNLKAKVTDEAVLKKLECRPGTVYEEFLEELKEMKEELAGVIKPIGAVALDELPERFATPKIPAKTRLAYVITGLGEEISRYSNRFFQEGDFVRGMLADAYADIYLFELEKSWNSQLISFCREENVGVARRLEVPVDLSLEIHRHVFGTIGAQELPGMSVSNGFMFYPVKTLCQIYLLTDDTSVYEVAHNCRVCKNKTCNMRNVLPARLQVRDHGESFSVFCEGEERILDALQTVNPNYSAVCGKRGLCGKCKIRLTGGKTVISAEEAAYFTKEELDAGYRLSCRAYPLEDCEIELFFEEDSMQVLSEEGSGRKTERKAAAGLCGTQGSYGIAVDIGTTTLAAQLVEIAAGYVLGTVVSMNHQRTFGADVISRIQASNEGKKEMLQSCIQKDLAVLFGELLAKNPQAGGRLGKIVITGNTTMEHLLMGYSCEKLGHLPFEPYNLEMVHIKIGELLGPYMRKVSADLEQNGVFTAPGSGEAEPLRLDEQKSEAVLLPGISAFVGADIVAGLLACGFDREEQVCFFLDLGTNGEMAVGNKDRILATATAAGPAFEGGNMEWGKGSIPGAICHVHINEKKQPFVETIEGKPPVGICGTGMIEAAAELLKTGIMDETGRLEAPYAKEGYPLAQTEDGEIIAVTQKDVRELQLAKAAVRAGIEILLQEYGVSCQELHMVYVAGGFGYAMDMKKAASVGLISKEMLPYIKAAGNSSLTGAREYLTEADAAGRMERIREASREVLLGGRAEFQEKFMDAMYFDTQV